MNLQSFMKSGSRFVGFCPLFLTVLVVVYFVDWFSSCFVGWCIAKWLAFQIILFDSDRSNMLADWQLNSEWCVSTQFAGDDSCIPRLQQRYRCSAADWTNELNSKVIWKGMISFVASHSVNMNWMQCASLLVPSYKTGNTDLQDCSNTPVLCSTDLQNLYQSLDHASYVGILYTNPIWKHPCSEFHRFARLFTLCLDLKHFSGFVQKEGTMFRHFQHKEQRTGVFNFV